MVRKGPADLAKGETRFGDGDVEGRGCGRQDAGRNYEVHHEQRPGKVAQVGEHPVLGQLRRRRLALKHLLDIARTASFATPDQFSSPLLLC